jgi:hypothetical protein
VQWREISYFVNDWTVPSCLPCPAHMTSAPGSAVCVCSAGSYGVTGGPLCEAGTQTMLAAAQRVMLASTTIFREARLARPAHRATYHMTENRVAGHVCQASTLQTLVITVITVRWPSI